MNLVYITGSSSGIGKAIAELLLQDNQNKVIGISRKQTITHKNYTHIIQDLSKCFRTNFFSLLSSNYKKVVLINNAGDIGPILKVGKQDYQQISENYSLNLITPSIFCNQFVKAYQGTSVEKVIINISSGAGKCPIEAWSTYCASKAGLDMFSQVLQIEHPALRVFSVAPGIVDTSMQRNIRNAKEEEFPHLKRFQDYKDNGELSSTREVAIKYLSIINQPQKFKEVLLSVRDF